MALTPHDSAMIQYMISYSKFSVKEIAEMFGITYNQAHYANCRKVKLVGGEWISWRMPYRRKHDSR